MFGPFWCHCMLFAGGKNLFLLLCLLGHPLPPCSWPPLPLPVLAPAASQVPPGGPCLTKHKVQAIAIDLGMWSWLCPQRGGGILLSPVLKLPLHAWGLLLIGRKGADPLGIHISIIQPRLILIFPFGSFVVFISRDFCHLSYTLQCA